MPPTTWFKVYTSFVGGNRSTNSATTANACLLVARPPYVLQNLSSSKLFAKHSPSKASPPAAAAGASVLREWWWRWLWWRWSKQIKEHKRYWRCRKKENGGFHFQRRQRGEISFAANAEVETIIKRERTNAQSLWLGSEKI